MDGGADCRKTSFPPCRLHHPHRHAVHDAIRRNGKKSGLRPFKKSGFRRYKNSHPCNPDYHAGHNTYGLILFPGASRAFFTAVGGLFVFVTFQPAYGQARLGGAANIRELAHVDISAPLWRIGRSPEKLQIFLCYSPLPFCPVRELKSLTIVPLFKGLEFLLTVFEVVVWYSSPLGGLEWGFRVG